MGVEVKTYGREIKALIASIVEDEVNRTTNLILRDARRTCPIETIESVSNRKTGNKAKQYGAKRGSLRKSGRIVKWHRNGVYGAYVKFGGVVVNGVDTYYGMFVELGTPGTVFQSKKSQKGYWGHKKVKVRVAVKAKSFLRPAHKRQKRKHIQRMQARLG